MGDGPARIPGLESLIGGGTRGVLGGTYPDEIRRGRGGRAAPAPGPGRREARFSRRGPADEPSPVSEAFWLTEPGILIAAQGVLSVPGSSTTVVTAYRNGSPIGTLTWTSGAQVASASFGDPFDARTDLLTVDCTAAGTGAAGISLCFEFV